MLFAIGDWDNEGHKGSEVFQVQSNTSYPELNVMNRTLFEKLGVDESGFAEDDEDRISQFNIDELYALGALDGDEKKYFERDEKKYFERAYLDRVDMVLIWIRMMEFLYPKVKIVVRQFEIPRINLSMGYGLFPNI